MKVAFALIMTSLLSVFILGHMNLIVVSSTDHCTETSNGNETDCIEVCRTAYLEAFSPASLEAVSGRPIFILIQKEKQKEVKRPYLIFRPPIESYLIA